MRLANVDTRGKTNAAAMIKVTLQNGGDKCNTTKNNRSDELHNPSRKNAFKIISIKESQVDTDH